MLPKLAGCINWNNQYLSHFNDWPDAKIGPELKRISNVL